MSFIKFLTFEKLEMKWSLRQLNRYLILQWTSCFNGLCNWEMLVLIWDAYYFGGGSYGFQDRPMIFEKTSSNPVIRWIAEFRDGSLKYPGSQFSWKIFFCDGALVDKKRKVALVYFQKSGEYCGFVAKYWHPVSTVTTSFVDIFHWWITAYILEYLKAF